MKRLRKKVNNTNEEKKMEINFQASELDATRSFILGIRNLPALHPSVNSSKHK